MRPGEALDRGPDEEAHVASILLIDDDPAILAVLSATFEAAGHTAIPAAGAEQGLAALRSHAIDAVVLDLMMPGISGWEVLERIRRDPQTETLPVMMLSAVGEPENRAIGLRRGADDFLAKPFEPEELLTRVDLLLARRASYARSLQGSLDAAPLVEVLQALGEQSGTLEIVGHDGAGQIQIADGFLVEAHFSNLAGSNAFFSLLEQSQGTFWFHPGDPPEGTPRDDLVASLLMEHSWIKNELFKRRRWLPLAEEKLMRRSNLNEIPAELAPLPIAAIHRAVSKRADLTLTDLLQLGLAPKNHVQVAVAWLLEEAHLAIR